MGKHIKFYTPEYINSLVLEFRLKMLDKGYSIWSIPKYKHGYLVSCLTHTDYHEASQIDGYVSIACISNNTLDMCKWVDSLPIIVPVPNKVKPLALHEGEMFT